MYCKEGRLNQVEKMPERQLLEDTEQALSRINNLPMRPLVWLSAIEFLNEHCPR